ncbi:MAG: CHASE2 domain-containing protein [Gammaproteobacteria bacterium]
MATYQGARALRDLLPVSDIRDRIILPLLILFSISILFVARAEHGLFEDMLHRAASERISGVDTPILVIHVDDETINTMGPQADHPAAIACLVNRVQAGNPRAIGLDYAFTGRTTGDVLPGCSTDQLPISGDGIPIVVGSVVSHSVGLPKEISPSRKIINQNTVEWGHSSIMLTTRDNVARSVQLVRKISNSPEYVPSLSFVLWLLSHGEDIDYEADGFTTAREFIASCIDHGIDMHDACDAVHYAMHPRRLRFSKIPGNIRVESAHSFFAGPCTDEQFFDILCAPLIRDKIVLIGSSYRGTGDTFISPIDSRPPFTGWFAGDWQGNALAGVILHAVALENLLLRTFVEPAPRMLQILFSVVAFIWPVLAFIAAGLVRTGVRQIAFLKPTGILASVLTFLGLEFLFLWGSFEIGVHWFITHSMVIFLSVAWPAHLVGLTLTLLFYAWILRARRYAFGKYVWRHVGEHGDVAHEGYRELFMNAREGVVTPGVITYLEFSNQSLPSRERAAESYFLQHTFHEKFDLDALSAAQSEDVLNFVDNWSCGRLGYYLVTDSVPSAQLLEAYIDKLKQVLALDGYNRIHGYASLGRVRILVYSGLIEFIDIPGPIEADVVSVSMREGELVAELGG